MGLSGVRYLLDQRAWARFTRIQSRSPTPTATRLRVAAGSCNKGRPPSTRHPKSGADKPARGVEFSPCLARLADPTSESPPTLGSWCSASSALLASSASTWVHYRILNDPTYASFCDVNATFSCTEAYASRFGSFGGVPVALFGVLFFAFVLVLIGLCSRSASAAANLPGYLFGVVDHRPRGGPLSCLRVVRHSQGGLRALRRHVRRRHRAVPPVRGGHQVSHDQCPSSRHP